MITTHIIMYLYYLVLVINFILKRIVKCSWKYIEVVFIILDILIVECINYYLFRLFIIAFAFYSICNI